MWHVHDVDSPEMLAQFELQTLRPLCLRRALESWRSRRNHPIASQLYLLARVAGLFAGWATTRPIRGLALGVDGAYLGHEFSNPDAWGIAAVSVAVRVVVSESLHYAVQKPAKGAYATGYDKGKRDAAIII